MKTEMKTAGEPGAENRILEQLRIGAGLARYIMRATFRNKGGYFFSFVFPVVFVVVFGLLGNARSPLRLGIAPGFDPAGPVYHELQRAAAGPEPVVELVPGSEVELRERLRQGKLAGILVPATGGGVVFVTLGSVPGAGAAAETYLKGILGELSLRAAGIERPAFHLEKRDLPGRQPKHIDFVLPGQIGFSMLSLATFGIAYNLAALRRTLVLKRMFATAARPLTFLVAQGFSRSVQAVVQTAAIIGLGVVVFDFHLAHGWATLAEMLVLAFLGIVSFFGFGILMTNVTPEDDTLPVLLNLFNLPQILLTGVFFPTDVMPGWLRAIGENLPLAYLNVSLRKAANEGAGLLELWPYLLGMFLWAAAAYVLAARTFRAE